MNKKEKELHARIARRFAKDVDRYISRLSDPGITIDDFEISRNKDGMEYVAWDHIEEVLGKKEYKKFREWMTGQTCVKEGAYPWDLRVYLERASKGLLYLLD